MKQNDWKTTGNCVSTTWYHLVWSTKYRYPVLVGAVAEGVAQILVEICALRSYEVKAPEIMPDYVHLLVSIPPAEAVADAIKVLNATSARLVFVAHPELKKRLWGGHLWNPAYYVGTAGRSAQSASRAILRRKNNMPLLTVNAVAFADPDTTNRLLDAMFCATKVYNGLLYAIQQALEETGRLDIGLTTLNGYLKALPRPKGYHSLSAQATRDEVIGAWESFKALKANGQTQHNTPGFRRKTAYSGLRYFGTNGVWLEGNTLRLSLGLDREDKVRQVTLRIAHRTDIRWKRLVNVLLTYDKRTGFTAHLVIEVDAVQPLGDRKVAFDLGETQIVTGVFDDGRAFLMNGRALKSTRRYWNKVRAKVKPPAPKQPMSKRFAQVAQKESRQIDHWLHVLSKALVERCYKAGVNAIAIGDLTGIRDRIDYGATLNQRLHAWPFAKLTAYITYKAEQYGMVVIKTDVTYTSQTCHACGLVLKSNRKARGDYQCACGWRVHADVNAAANILERAFQVSPFKRRSGGVTTPAVMALQVELKRHIACKSHRLP